MNPRTQRHHRPRHPIHTTAPAGGHLPAHHGRPGPAATLCSEDDRPLVPKGVSLPSTCLPPTHLQTDPEPFSKIIPGPNCRCGKRSLCPGQPPCSVALSQAPPRPFSESPAASCTPPPGSPLGLLAHRGRGNASTPENQAGTQLRVWFCSPNKFDVPGAPQGTKARPGTPQSQN